MNLRESRVDGVIDIVEVIKEETLKFLQDSMAWGEKFESLKQVSGCCAGNNETDFDLTIERHFNETLDLMKYVPVNSIEYLYCKNFIDIYTEYNGVK